jgi:xanthine dehydrogenase molybdenum-binding subunit
MAKDTPRIRFGFRRDHLPLKEGKVRSVRDEIAAVAALDEATATEALQQIEVEYEPLPGVFDPLDALAPTAPLVHDELKTNQVPLPFAFSYGAVERALREADAVVESTYRLPFVNATALGTMGCLASYDATGELTVWANTQAPFEYQRELGAALGLPGDRIRVIQPKIGGSFGRGMDVYPLDIITALLAMKTRRPVRILQTREEEFAYAPTRQPCIIRLRQGARRDGKLQVRDAEVYLDNGPYVSWGAFDARVMLATTTGLYRVPHVRFQAHVVYTNNPYSGTQRGAGNPQMTFAIESQMDELAAKLATDPLQFRLQNVNQPGDVTPQRMRITTCAFGETLRQAARTIGWQGRQKAGPHRGIGFAGYFHVGGGARVYRSDGCGAVVKLDDFGRVTIITGMSEIGTGSDTAIAQVVAEELSIPLDRITVVNDDTRVRPWDVGIHASRGTFVGGNAALLAARQVRGQLLAAAAELLDEPAKMLELQSGMVWSRRDTAKRLAHEKIVRARHFRPGGDAFVGEAFYDPPNEMQDSAHRGNISATYGFGTQAVLLEVEPDTGAVRVLRVVSVHDAGRILNPLGAEGQVEGGVIMGLGYALTEQLVLEEGRVINPDLGQYKLITSMEAPEIAARFVGAEDPAGPFGAKGIGEAGCIPIAAAVANAICDALGVRIRDLPITPERVLAAFRDDRGSRPHVGTSFR